MRQSAGCCSACAAASASANFCAACTERSLAPSSIALRLSAITADTSTAAIALSSESELGAPTTLAQCKLRWVQAATTGALRVASAGAASA